MARYYDVYSAHVHELQPLFEKSQTYQTLTAGLNNTAAFTASPSLRALQDFAGAQLEGAERLSHRDKRFLKFFNRLMSQWALGADSNFDSKLSLIQRLLEEENPTKVDLDFDKALEGSFRIKDDLLQDSLEGIEQLLNSSSVMTGRLQRSINRSLNLTEIALV